MHRVASGHVVGSPAMPEQVLILASRSPRRRDLLRRQGLRFTVRASGIPEDAPAHETPEQTALRLATEKALAVAARLGDRASRRACVLGADTVVALGDTSLGKPRDRADARRMLRLLSGRTHRVVTGVAVWRGSDGLIRRGRRVTRVTFARLTPREIDRYVATGEPMDKAGAYAIQGGAEPFVLSIEGSWTNVVGLPLDLVRELLIETGFRVRTGKNGGRR